jgi:hypothetical protein
MLWLNALWLKVAGPDCYGPAVSTSAPDASEVRAGLQAEDRFQIKFPDQTSNGPSFFATAALASVTYLGKPFS